ncbi:hypothetical protein [Streptomyces subrutilus]|uniref:Uncharacterized protein n=1 Tax=Streptomyces subrutilus TaxID=36818 RepID=A0A1E5Q252_9ACTN|nr:hypothetical protein [Streptomyces subrutilus]OEJ35806.1 hypothetical protein BGK67_18790 [Streptomyces subrutilus]
MDGDAPHDWVSAAWSMLDDRSRGMLALRDQGQVLESIGEAHGLTRERARQLIHAAEGHLVDLMDLARPAWREEVLAPFSAAVAVSDTELAEILPDADGVARRALLRRLDLKEPQTWAGRLRRVWTHYPEALDDSLRQLMTLAPFRAEELRDRAAALGIPACIPLEEIAVAPRGPLTRGLGGTWLRRSAKHRDAAYLWLADEGQPRRAEVVAPAIGAGSARALKEALRRDDRFRQIRPEGTWALSEWPAAESSQHTNALDVMVAVLRRSGALTKQALFSLTAKEYPVSYSRLQQCLISDQLGMTADGSIDLAENGAIPMEEREPRRPKSIAADGDTIGIRLKIDANTLRGSGIVVHPWLTWRFGLRLAPMTRVFTLPNGSGELVARRMTSGAQISSLRPHVRSAGMHEGCEIAILFHLKTNTATIRHTCKPGASCGVG